MGNINKQTQFDQQQPGKKTGIGSYITNLLYKGGKNKTHKFYKKTSVKTKRNRQLLAKLKKYNKTKRGHK
jgi:hypothetical protein